MYFYTYYISKYMQKKIWWKESVFYQIYPRSFNDSNGDGIGDIQGIIEKLDYLKDLGVDIIWLSPVYASPNDDNGYDISDYYQIMPEFGTMEDWEEMVEEIHKREMKLMMDLVVNHTSDEHHWFKEAKKSKKNKYRDYYIWKEGKEGKKPNNWESFFSGPAWEYNEETKDYYLHLFSKKQPDLNWENTELREEIYKMMNWWLSKGVDGFRMDVINVISKTQGLPSVDTKEELANGSKYYMNGPRLHEFLQEMNQKVLSAYDIVTVGETPGVSVEDAKNLTADARKELHMVFQFELMDISSGEGGKWDIKPWSLLEFKKIISKWQIGLEKEGWNSLYLGNHDQPRCISAFGNDKEYRELSGKLLATMLLTLQGSPYIYQGDEIGMTNTTFDSIEDCRDIESINMFHQQHIEKGVDATKLMELICKKGRDNARTPMQWNEEKNAGFTIGTPWIAVNDNYKDIHVKAQREDKDSIFSYYKRMIQLRKNEKVMVYGTYKQLEEEHEQLFMYKRIMGDKEALVVLNFSDEKVDYEVSRLIENKGLSLVIGNYKKIEDINRLEPYEARVYM